MAQVKGSMTGMRSVPLMYSLVGMSEAETVIFGRVMSLEFCQGQAVKFWSR